jgi:hypothetical protein
LERLQAEQPNIEIKSRRLNIEKHVFGMVFAVQNKSLKKSLWIKAFLRVSAVKTGFDFGLFWTSASPPRTFRIHRISIEGILRDLRAPAVRNPERVDPLDLIGQASLSDLERLRSKSWSWSVILEKSLRMSLHLLRVGLLLEQGRSAALAVSGGIQVVSGLSRLASPGPGRPVARPGGPGRR